MGKWNNVLVRAPLEERDTVKTELQPKLTAKQKREMENQEAVGGLRNPRSAVRKSKELRLTGERIRHVVEDHMRLQEVQVMCQDCTRGISRD